MVAKKVTKKSIVDKLTALGVDVDPNLPVNELENILADKEAEGAENKEPTETAEKPADMAEEGKNFADKSERKKKTGGVDPRIGTREVTTNGPDQKIVKIGTKAEVLKLQEEGRLVHIDEAQGLMAIRNKIVKGIDGKPKYDGQFPSQPRRV